MGWYTSEQAFACKSATGSTDPLPRMRNASRIGCSERSLAAVAKLYGALRAAHEWGVEGRSGSWYARIGTPYERDQCGHSAHAKGAQGR